MYFTINITRKYMLLLNLDVGQFYIVHTKAWKEELKSLLQS